MAGKKSSPVYIKTESGYIAANHQARRIEKAKARRGLASAPGLKGVSMNDKGQMRYKPAGPLKLK